MPSKKPQKAAKHQLNPYTRFFDAQKSLPQDKGDSNGQKPSGVYNRESVYVLSNKPRGKRRPIRENNQPTWRRRGGGGAGNEDHIMVVTQDSTQQPRDKPVYTASQLDAICYDVIKEPPMQFHVDGTDIVPSIRGLRLSVCVEHTRFQLVGKVTRNMGFQHVPEHRLWNIQWSDSTPHHDLLLAGRVYEPFSVLPTPCLVFVIFLLLNFLLLCSWAPVFYTIFFFNSCRACSCK